jgi:hypothetical protein
MKGWKRFSQWVKFHNPPFSDTPRG